MAGLGLACAGLLWQAMDVAWPGFVVLAAVTGCSAISALHWWREAAGQLCWDGAQWTWAGAGEPETGTLEAVLDLQWVLLGWFRAVGGRHRPFWLERRLAPGIWDDLRRAVYSRASIDALRGPVERERSETAAS